MKIPFVDLKREANSVSDELLEITTNVINSGNYIMGPNLDLFEKKFAEYCDVKYAIGVGNGSDALVLIMKSLGIGKGDEVICPTNSFIASAWSIVSAGANPVFCDVEDDFLVSVETISEALTASTKAVMVAHLTGKVCDMQNISKFCKEKNLLLIEDSAQAIGAYDDQNKKAGSSGIAGAFSLHPLKNLAVYGDGGVVTTDSQKIAEKVKTLRNHGLINRDTCLYWGLNTRLDELQAGYGLVKMKYLEAWTKKYISIAHSYSLGLSDKVIKPKTISGSRDVFHNYVITVDPKIRNKIMAELLSIGVETKIHYPIPLHLQPCSADLGYKNGDLPNAERLSKSMISLPIYPLLKDDEVEYVIESINKVVNKLN